MSTATCRLQVLTTVQETLDEASAPAAAAGSRVITHDQYNTANALVPNVTKGTAGKIAMTDGAATLDLTAVPSPEGTLNLNGLKVKVLRFRNPAGNAAITIGEGASNGYEAAGDGWSVTLAAGESATLELAAAPTVGALAKEIDIAGTGTEELEFVVAAGT